MANGAGVAGGTAASPEAGAPDDRSDLDEDEDEDDLTLGSDPSPSCIGDILREQHPVLLLEVLLKCRTHVTLRQALPIIRGMLALVVCVRWIASRDEG